MITINLKDIYGETAKLSRKEEYIDSVVEKAGKGNDIVLTGEGPIWLYLLISHALHGRVRSLTYSSPVTGEVKIFDHDPF